MYVYLMAFGKSGHQCQHYVNHRSLSDILQIVFCQYSYVNIITAQEFNWEF